MRRQREARRTCAQDSFAAAEKLARRASDAEIESFIDEIELRKESLTRALLATWALRNFFHHRDTRHREVQQKEEGSPPT